jgi:hypothetical protein
MGKTLNEQMILNDTQKRRLEIEQQYWESARKLNDPKDGCKHINIDKGRLIYSPAKRRIVQTHEENQFKDDDCVTVSCQDCDTEFGWFCSVNPKKYCEYDWSTTGENCIFCHQPKERK